MRFVVKFLGSLLPRLCLSFCYVSTQLHLTTFFCAFSLEPPCKFVINLNLFHWLPIYRLRHYQLQNPKWTQRFANTGFLRLVKPTFLVPFLKQLTQSGCLCRKDSAFDPYLAYKSAMKSIVLICLAQKDLCNLFVDLDLLNENLEFYRSTEIPNFAQFCAY